MTTTNTLPPAVVVLDHSNPVDFEREAMPLLGTLMIDYLRAEAAHSKRTDAELAAIATFGVPGDLCHDQATAAAALLRARRGTLDEMHPALVARAAQTLAEVATA